MRAAPLALLLVLVAPANERPTWELPEGTAAELAARAAAVAPAHLGHEPWPPGLDDPGWDRVAPWLRWAELVRLEAAAGTPDPRRRAELALLAAATGRSNDAWRHFEACSAAPAVAAAVLPRLFPGTPQDLAPDAPLPAGVVLRPLLPPPSEHLPHGSFDLARLAVHDLVVGDARLDVSLELARDGVQVDVLHTGGQPVRLALLLPVPTGYASDVEYVDWDRQGDVGRPRTIRCAPGTEEEREHALWLRFAPAPRAWPGIDGAEPERLLDRVRRVGLALEPDAEHAARACGLALALAEVLRAPVIERSPGAGPPPVGPSPIAVRLAGEGGARGLRRALSLAERLVLGDRDRGRD